MKAKSIWSPVVFYLQNGIDSLKHQLSIEDVDVLRNIIIFYHIGDIDTDESKYASMIVKYVVSRVGIL